MWPALFQVTTVERRPCCSGITWPAESPSWKIANRGLVVLFCACDIYCMYCFAPRKRVVKHFEAGRRRSWLICMGLVREYDVVWGLLLLIPGVREQSPYPYTHTHTHTHTHKHTQKHIHVTARLQAPQLSISTQIRQTQHPRTTVWLTAHKHTHTGEVRAYAHLWTRRSALR